MAESTDWTLGRLGFGQLQQAEGMRRSPGVRLRSTGATTTSWGGCQGGWGGWGWRGVGEKGVHEALRCHRNVSPCQVQSSLAVIFWAIRELISRTLARWRWWWRSSSKLWTHTHTHLKGRNLLNNSQESTHSCSSSSHQTRHITDTTPTRSVRRFGPNVAKNQINSKKCSEDDEHDAD